MQLTDITKHITCKKIYNLKNQKKYFNNIQTNSKLINNKSLLAINNKEFKNKFFLEAINKNVVGIITSKYYKKISIPQFIVHDVNLSIYNLLNTLFPAPPLNTVGITGTNGKTSVAWFISQICFHSKVPVKTYGTLGYYIDGKKKENSDLTTPNFEVLFQKSNLKKNNPYNFIFEVSSHALDQDRIKNFNIDTAALTNISHDHLDYHKNMKEYIKAKLKLFSKKLKKDGHAILNDNFKEIDKFKKKLNKKIRIITYGKKSSDVYLNIKNKKNKIKIYKKNYILNLKQNNSIDLENISCAIACCLALKINTNKIIESLKKLKNPPGRLQKVMQSNNFKVYIDYAHTPDALKKVLVNLTKKNKKPNLLFGCGGQRDKEKRSKMGMIANKYANKVYITDDNPRNEDPGKIRKAILQNCKKGIEINNRKKAIKIAIKELKKNDILIIAGKGHEKIQIYKNQIKSFDDFSVANFELKKLIKNEN